MSKSNSVFSNAGKKAAIKRKLNKQLKTATSPSQAAAFKAHATRRMKSL